MYKVMREKKKIENLKAYLYAIARNNALGKINARSREYSDEDLLARLPDENYYADPARYSANRKQQTDITQALMMMPGNYREVLILREQAGFSYDKIASLLGTNKTNVGVLIYRARAKFRELYRMLQVTQEPATDECEAMLPLISSWLDGETTRKQEVEVQKHMQECPFCKLASEQMVEASSSYHSLVPLAVPLAIKAGLMAKAGLAGLVPTSLAASAAGAATIGGAAGVATAGPIGGAAATAGAAGSGSIAAGVGTGAGVAAAGLGSKAIGIAVAAVIAVGAIGGGTYAGIRVVEHRQVATLERQLKTEISEFVSGKRIKVDIPDSLRQKAGDLTGAAHKYMNRYLPDWTYDLNETGQSSELSNIIHVKALPTGQPAQMGGNPNEQALDCYLDVLKKQDGYQVDKMIKESKQQ